MKIGGMTKSGGALKHAYEVLMKEKKFRKIELKGMG